MNQNEAVSIDLPQLSEFFKKRDIVICAFLFGSAVEGTVRPGGDVDLAVLLKKDALASCMMDLYVAVSKILENIEFIDIVRLNVAEPILAFEAVSGKKIADNDHAKTAEFISLTSRLYEDSMASIEYQLSLRHTGTC
ncbi:MAG: hypothetical protein GXP32_02900 [Kiritimatiellaeota bacterium]|nr:hypothetical protein [Kiritimatiellota bacterium]